MSKAQHLRPEGGRHPEPAAHGRTAVEPASPSWAAQLQHSPRLVAQREQIDRTFGSAAAAPNRTGMPDALKSGIEALSGIDMSAVQVHRNSDRPAQLNALAYAQGRDIHLAPGQEQHLPHEAWHVVQQAQGRVSPTLQAGNGTPVNDDPALESEADAMGGRALQMKPGPERSLVSLPLGESAPTQAVQRKLGFEFEILVNTDTEGDDDDPLVTVNKKTEDDVAHDRPGAKLFEVVSDNSRGSMVVNKKDFKKLDPAVQNKKILEIVTAPIDEFGPNARDELSSQMDALVLFGRAIQTATVNLAQPVSLQAICLELSRLLASDRYNVTPKDNVVIGRDQAALEAEGISKSVQTKVQSLSASPHYTVGIDFERLPEYITKLVANPELGNRKRDGTRQKTTLTDASGLATTLMADKCITDVDIAGAEGDLKGFFLSVILNLSFGKIEQSGLSKNYSPLLGRTDGVLVLNAIDAKKPGVKQALKDNWVAISSRIKSLTGTVGSDRSMNGGSDKYPTVDAYLGNLVNAAQEGFTQAFGDMKKMGPEDVGPRFEADPREKGFIYENRSMKGGDGDRVAIGEWKAFALRIFDEVKAVNTKPTTKV